MASSASFSFFRPRPASSHPPPSSEDADADLSTEIEKLCLEECGLDLQVLKDRLSRHSEELQSSLHDFCNDVLRSDDAARRRDLAMAFIQGLARIFQLATDQSISTLVEMQTAFLENLQKENDSLLSKNDLLRNKLSRSEGEAAEFKRAWRRSEAEKEGIEAEARERFEAEKAALEVSLREEMRACQICETNARNVVIMPCFHGQYCAGCLEVHQRNNNTCPACRGVIRGTMPYIA